MEKYDKNNYLQDALINPKFKLNSDSIKVFVSIEVPDNVAVSLSAELQDKGY